MCQIEKTVQNLNRRGFHAEELNNADELFEKLCGMIPAGSGIGCGGSMTLAELGILKRLQAAGYEVYSASVNPRTDLNFFQEGRNAQYFLTGTNAVTEDGVLVNTDGRGSRVCSMICGVPHVIVVAGQNKITADIPAAIDRIKNVAAPLNCKRLKRNTPCVKTGRCMDCNSPDRICRATVIQTNPGSGTEMTVFLLPLELGY